MNECRDTLREDMFLQEYRFRPAIHIYYETNPDHTFKVFRLRFNYKDKERILTEQYDGNSNLTSHCTVSGIDEQFKRFIDAEKKIVELLKD